MEKRNTLEEEIFAVKLSDIYCFNKNRSSYYGFCYWKPRLKKQFKDCITVVRYEKETGKFEEFYTGLSLGYMPLAEFKENYAKDLEDFAFVQAYFQLCEKGPLFFEKMDYTDEEVSAKIYRQQGRAEEIKKEILKIYKNAKVMSEINFKWRVELFRSNLDLDLEVAYGENLLYDFKHGINRTRKIDITDKNE